MSPSRRLRSKSRGSEPGSSGLPQISVSDYSAVSSRQVTCLSLLLLMHVSLTLSLSLSLQSLSFRSLGSSCDNEAPVREDAPKGRSSSDGAPGVSCCCSRVTCLTAVSRRLSVRADLHCAIILTLMSRAFVCRSGAHREQRPPLLACCCLSIRNSFCLWGDPVRSQLQLPGRCVGGQHQRVSQPGSR